MLIELSSAEGMRRRSVDHQAVPLLVFVVVLLLLGRIPVSLGVLLVGVRSLG